MAINWELHENALVPPQVSLCGLGFLLAWWLVSKRESFKSVNSEAADI